MTSSPDPMHDIVDRVRHITGENERLFQRLIEGERRFRGLAKAVWKVQEDERRRLARELHDGLGQTLTALTNQLERLQKKLDGRISGELSGDLSAHLADSVDMARSALNETRELSRLLRPPVLDDLGLTAALSWLARTLEQRTGLRAELTLEGLAERLDPDLETLVFRLIQEALTNVLRHAGVDRAEVTVSRAGGFLALRIADAGRGFEFQAAFAGSESTAGSGLRGMRDRLELFGGRLDISSAPGQGTVIAAMVPLLESAG
ncbi:MAG TPA: sensor histidine kinase [Thermoanaerobaculia bacterium]|nr:sensor histidine kinase [Thermoanaerobaculia bacterium]